MSARARVMVVERVLPDRIVSSPSHLNAAMTDLQMMVQLGSQERTLDEYVRLFDAASLKLDRFTPGGVYKLVEAVAT